MRKTLWRVAAIAAAASIWLAPSSAAQSRRPEDLVDAFVAAWNSHDVNAFERLFAADADWVTTYDVRDDGRANILADLKETHEGWAKSSTIVSSKVSVRVLRPDVAVVHFNAALTPTLGGTPIGRTMLLVAVKHARAWSIASGQITKPNCPSK